MSICLQNENIKDKEPTTLKLPTKQQQCLITSTSILPTTLQSTMDNDDDYYLKKPTL